MKLADGGYFTWDKTTGQMTYNGKPLLSDSRPKPKFENYDGKFHEISLNNLLKMF